MKSSVSQRTSRGKSDEDDMLLDTTTATKAPAPKPAASAPQHAPRDEEPALGNLDIRYTQP